MQYFKWLLHVFINRTVSAQRYNSSSTDLQSGLYETAYNNLHVDWKFYEKSNVKQKISVLKVDKMWFKTNKKEKRNKSSHLNTCLSV